MRPDPITSGSRPSRRLGLYAGGAWGIEALNCDTLPPRVWGDDERNQGEPRTADDVMAMLKHCDKCSANLLHWRSASAFAPEVRA